MSDTTKMYVVVAFIVSSLFIIGRCEYTKLNEHVRQQYPMHRRGEVFTTRRHPLNQYNYRRSFYPNGLAQNTTLRKGDGIARRQMHLTSNQV